jgi:protein-S-isoprenylcysteine O-methyltransferase Ste14
MIMMKTLSILGYLGMVGGLVALLAMRKIFSSSPLVISLQVVAFLLMLWARVAFGRRSFHAEAHPTEGGLVTGGPYRYIRHPIYAAVCLFIWAGVIGHWSWNAALCGALVLAGAILRIFCEEPLVAARYPEYAQYKATTWRMIPYVY